MGAETDTRGTYVPRRRGRVLPSTRYFTDLGCRHDVGVLAGDLPNTGWGEDCSGRWHDRKAERERAKELVKEDS